MALRVVKLVACRWKGSFRVDRSRPIVGAGLWVGVERIGGGELFEVLWGTRGSVQPSRAFLHSARAKTKTAANDGAVYTSVTL